MNLNKFGVYINYHNCVLKCLGHSNQTFGKVFCLENLSPSSAAPHVLMGHFVSKSVLSWRTYGAGYRMPIDYRGSLAKRPLLALLSTCLLVVLSCKVFTDQTKINFMLVIVSFAPKFQ